MDVEQLIKTEKKIPLERRTIIHVMLVHNYINERITTALRPYEVSLQQFNVLRILRGQRGKPANLSTINERMVSKMSNTTRLVDKLLSKGFVSRITCPTNRRKIEISITADGLEALKAMDQAMNAVEKELVGKLSKSELENLNHLLHKF